MDMTELEPQKLWIETDPSENDKGLHAKIISSEPRGSMVDLKFERGNKLYKCNVKKVHFNYLKYRCGSQPSHAWGLLNSYCINLYTVPTMPEWMLHDISDFQKKTESVVIPIPDSGKCKVMMQKYVRRSSNESWFMYLEYEGIVDKAHADSLIRMAKHTPNKLWSEVEEITRKPLTKIYE